MPPKTRQFLVKWQVGRPWLSYDKNVRKMFCTTCQTAAAYDSKLANAKNISFVTGCHSLKLESVIQHEQSKQHKQSRLITKNRLEKPESAPSVKIIETMNTEFITKMAVLFRNAHAVAMSMMANKNYVNLCQLDIAKGIIKKEARYVNNSVTCSEFIHAIAG